MSEIESHSNIAKEYATYVALNSPPEKIADKICKHGLQTPAVFFLEMTKPVSLLGSHVLVFFGPIINAFIQAENYYRTVEVFEEPGNIERLLKAIEHRARK